MTLFQRILRSFLSLCHPELMGVMVKALGVSLGIVLAVSLAGYLLGKGLYPHFPVWLLAILTMGVMTIVFSFFPMLFLAMGSLFAESIIPVIERYEYPYAIPQQSVDTSREILCVLAFVVRIILINLFVMPVIQWILPVIGGLAYFAINGWLVGKEMYRIVAQRFYSPPALQELTHRYRWGIWRLGIVIVVVAIIPVVNLLSPFLGVALMVHYYHQNTPPSPSVKVVH